MVEASEKLQEYFKDIKTRVQSAHKIASEAREQGFDPVNTVEMQLAENMAERVVGLISVLAPKIVNSGVVERIIELEKKYGALDWRVALKIAAEIAQQKFCSFDSQLQAIDIGVRTGFAYVTVGVVSSPLDGIVSISLKDRMDGAGQYLCLSYAGPVRNAGGTAAAVSVIIADYVRKELGIAAYDATPDEVKRATVELQDYHDRVTNLQYHPSEDEMNVLMPNLPVEVSGEPSERFEVSMCKDLPRINSNIIRSGYCLVLSSCIPLKAPKLWKQLGKWGEEFGLGHWNFLEEFLKVQKKAKSKGAKPKEEDEGSKADKPKIALDFSYIKDLVAGRPILGHPQQHGGFRLRYGRSRASGLSGQAINPATMIVLDDYIAVGTQLKVGRPGKGATYTPCDTIQGPVVKLENGDVVYCGNEEIAHKVKRDVVEILFLGDVLIDLGDFINRAHPLLPVGYCEEWWKQDIKAACEKQQFTTPTAQANACSIELGRWQEIITNIFNAKPTVAEAARIAKALCVPMHAAYTFHWGDLNKEQAKELILLLQHARLTIDDNKIEKIILPLEEKGKRSLECAGVPHKQAIENIVISGENAQTIAWTFNLAEDNRKAFLEKTLSLLENQSLLEALNAMGKTLRDKSGMTIGARMGRPEKAKMRKLTGSPHALFPVGEEGGRLRSFQAALEKKFITADFPLYFCPCGNQTPFRKCEECGEKTTQKFFAGNRVISESGEGTKPYLKREVDIVKIMRACTKKLQLIIPDQVKGVRGTSNAEHTPEHLMKGLLRAKNNVFVNKDGTIRYDASELTLTHFKPKEIGTSVEKLKELGYTHDCFGNELTSDNQVLEIFPQDAVLPSCKSSPNETAEDVLLRITQFIDDELEKIYHLPRFFNAKKKDDLIGHLLIALAPHTSAGLAVRIIGFSGSQGFLAHPYVHQACRRDCDGDEIGFMLLLDGFLNFSQKFLPSSRGGTMDAPLVLTSVVNPEEVDDQAFDVGISWEYPLELYTASIEMKMPWEVKTNIIKNVLGTKAQFEGMGFTHDTDNINAGVLCSAYKTLPTMGEKMEGQMKLARKIRAVDARDVAERVIEKHFLKDTKGNLRKFSQQQFRCVGCNEKFRRPPLCGKCTKCNGKIIFTISQGSILKYLQPAIDLANTYDVNPYLKQTMEILELTTDSIFGREKEKQTGLANFF